MFINATIDIAVISMLLSGVSRLLQRKFIDQKEMKSRQEEMKKKQNRLKELAKRQDPKSKGEAEALEKEIMENASTIMRGSMRMMMYSMLIFIPAFGFLGATYAEAIINLPVPIPWFGANGIELFYQTSWVGWYVLISLIFSLVFNIIFKFIDKKGF